MIVLLEYLLDKYFCTLWFALGPKVVICVQMEIGRQANMLFNDLLYIFLKPCVNDLRYYLF